MEFRLTLPVQSSFFFGYVPNVLKSRFRRERSRGKFTQIENYLDKINLGYNIIDILDTLIDTMSTIIENRYVLYRVGDNRPFKDTKYTLNQLLNLIEYMLPTSALGENETTKSVTSATDQFTIVLADDTNASPSFFIGEDEEKSVSTLLPEK